MALLRPSLPRASLSSSLFSRTSPLSSRPRPSSALPAEPDCVDPDEYCPHALARGIKSKGVERVVWTEIREGAIAQSREQSWRTLDLQDFGVDNFLQREVLKHYSLACGLAEGVGGKLAANARIGGGVDYEKVFLSAFRAEPDLCTSVASDILRFKEVDPAARGGQGLLGVYLFYKGVHALACARVAGHYWRRRGEAGKLIARLLQSEGSDMYGVDIHPGARLGDGALTPGSHLTQRRAPTPGSHLTQRRKQRRAARHAQPRTAGITIDHATGVVIGETSVVADNVYLMHDVTLGATGTGNAHDRHPKIGAGAFLGAKSTVLGNIHVGEGATIAASALVNKPVPPGYTAVGVPARLLPPPKDSKYWKPQPSKRSPSTAPFRPTST